MLKNMRFVLALSLLLIIRAPLLAQDVTVESRITQVTVYPGNALLTRTAALKLNPGEYKIIFPGIIPEIDEDSLRVGGNLGEGVKILGAVVKKEFLEETPSERAQKIQNELQSLGDEIRMLEDGRKVLEDEKQFLDSVRLFSNNQIPQDLITRAPQVKELEDILNFLGTRLKENYLQVMEVQLKTREINKRIEVLRKELSQASGPSDKVKRSIIVELDASKPVEANLTVSYLVGGASWQMLYDARADFKKSEVELISYGIVRQSTGEDWPEAQISLSTAQPLISGSLPSISSWILRPYQPPQILYGRGKHFKAAMPVPMDMALEREEAMPEVPVAYSQPVEKGVAVVYKLIRKSTIKADGSEYKLPISTQTLQAKFEYSAYPRLSTYAYLGSRVTNAKDLQLLSGRINIFLEGDFVGNSTIGNIGPGEEFDLYLGVDENVKVKREQVEKLVDVTLIAGIPSPTRRTTFKYKLTVENYKTKKIGVKLFEATPVPEDDRIKVKINQVSLEPKAKDWENRKGIWLWELSLEPKAKQEIFLTLTVEHPREMQVEGL